MRILLCIAVLVWGAQMSEAAPAPAVVVEAFDEYVAGLPMVVAITLENRTTDTGLGPIPEFNELDVKAPLIFAWSNGTQHEVKVPWSAADPPRGIILSPGDSLRMLFDLSTLHAPPRPGSYDLVVKLRYRDQLSAAKPIKLKVVAATHADAPALAVRTEHSWPEYVTNHQRTVAPPTLPPHTARLIAWHLFLQRVAHSPQPLAEIDLGELTALRQGPTAAEAELIRYELLRARNDPSAAALGKEIAKHWPGVRLALSRIDAGGGPIADLRDLCAPP